MHNIYQQDYIAANIPVINVPNSTETPYCEDVDKFFCLTFLKFYMHTHHQAQCVDAPIILEAYMCYLYSTIK